MKKILLFLLALLGTLSLTSLQAILVDSIQNMGNASVYFAIISNDMHWGYGYGGIYTWVVRTGQKIVFKSLLPARGERDDMPRCPNIVDFNTGDKLELTSIAEGGEAGRFIVNGHQFERGIIESDHGITNVRDIQENLVIEPSEEQKQRYETFTVLIGADGEISLVGNKEKTPEITPEPIIPVN